ncbi:protein phosphatase 2C domain-containing protein [Paenibacillus campinasensis]|uniref:Protein phosphatase 2C domain-containing protein n=1 Tax=Paenibacillus campinasensis TaxID=66347 RepID=A0ABW9T627_9BACL|nr:protein phosphatase 2C domain-containing protein [Paenibacillus campinasensis]MUG68552.1 protein phosphatase 2C domain-containing protein [Paenibacillus campinasensis]
MKRVESVSCLWTGDQQAYLDQPSSKRIRHVTVGRYGGCTEGGACKNEDGFLLWLDEAEAWEFAVIVDAHSSCQSAVLILETLQHHESSVRDILRQPLRKAVDRIERWVLDIFQSDGFLVKCRAVQGEASCLICLRIENMLWWFSVGDCQLFLFHDELESWGQNSMNQRNFYEWIGQVNTFEQAVPSYSLGRRQLRTGRSGIMVMTDGYLEAEGCVSAMPDLGRGQMSGDEFLARLVRHRTVDSTTFIRWSVHNAHPAALPSS